jgi:hypothetical protein
MLKAKIEVDKDGLREGAQPLINLATAVPERNGAKGDQEGSPSFHG